ncbi:MAG: hypothetical protein EBQ56_06305 [Proteobacteria bacterium]|nr:hypothetical protein [Pseudomonadota bacterium]NCV21457.1 hypothetical protein [Chloroflexota bacterium]NBY47375.1 hypothetical protein [Pseudomonadota bacterium]NCV01465.1 hypothetical protein [Pseudomonadota bacterium]NDE08036.1 hypothetical protein [Chloroflexota bacterium]
MAPSVTPCQDCGDQTDRYGERGAAGCRKGGQQVRERVEPGDQECGDNPDSGPPPRQSVGTSGLAVNRGGDACQVCGDIRLRGGTD